MGWSRYCAFNCVVDVLGCTGADSKGKRKESDPSPVASVAAASVTTGDFPRGRAPVRASATPALAAPIIERERDNLFAIRDADGEATASKKQKKIKDAVKKQEQAKDRVAQRNKADEEVCNRSCIVLWMPVCVAFSPTKHVFDAGWHFTRETVAYVCECVCVCVCVCVSVCVCVCVCV